MKLFNHGREFSIKRGDRFGEVQPDRRTRRSDAEVRK
jgi:hypothetical protein